jgi:magnesium transporter
MTSTAPPAANDLEHLIQDPVAAAQALEARGDRSVAEMLDAADPITAQWIVDSFPADRRDAVLALVSAKLRDHYRRNARYPEDTVGRLMEPPIAVFPPTLTVGETIDRLRILVKQSFITYGYVVDEQLRLVGLLVMRDMLLADRHQRLEEIMLKEPFALLPETSLVDAMRATVTRHYPVYPVCDAERHLIGLVRGSVLFQANAIEITAQAGSMVGVEKEERVATPWQRSLKFRQPWLQLNLLTAFVAGAVVSVFQETIDQLVVLAAFLPVLAGQSGNTGCQALAVTLRAMTLGELRSGKERGLMIKEAFLGFLNGALVGVTAAAGMYVLARSQDNPSALALAFVVMIAMTFSCVVSGVAGAAVPLVLKRLGADPATASSIFLTTATDVASMGLLLSLATWLVL